MGIFGPHVARSHQLKLQRYAYMQLAKLLTQVSGRSRTPHEICSKIMQDRQAVRRVVSFLFQINLLLISHSISISLRIYNCLATSFVL